MDQGFSYRCLGPFFQKERKRKGLKQKEVAQHLGCTAQFLSNFEVGKSSLPKSSIRELIKLYKTSSQSLMNQLMLRHHKDLL